jgi:hypothetical protein
VASISVVIDTKGLERKLTRLERQQLPFARSLAANQAAFETMNTLRTAASLIVDNPTPFTVAGIRYRRGNKESPAAEIYLSGDAAKGTAPAKYLTIARGGRRGQRRSERLLARSGLIEPNEGWVPAAGLKLNRFGNPSPAKIIQALSGIKAFGEQGFSGNLTARSRARGRARGRAEFFFSRGDRLARGIWERYGPGRKQVRPLLLIIPLPTYSKEFDFVTLAIGEARRRFVAAWPAALRRALTTAR